MVKTEKTDAVVIGGGQAGLAAGYYLAQQGRDFVILDAQERSGDSWRKRWDSLRLFTPASFNGLPGMPFRKAGEHAPSKDDMAGYLEAYATRFHLPVQFGVRVDEVARAADGYQVVAGTRRLKANHVIVATGAYSAPRVPGFAGQLDPSLNQLHSAAYRNPSHLSDGAALVVGAGNSGVEIALELAATRPTWLAGRDTGSIPVHFQSFRYQVGTIIFKALMQRLTDATPPGRWLVGKAREFTGGHPVIGVMPADLAQAGVERVPRVVGVSGGRPLLDGGRVLDVANVIWATGFARDSHRHWIKLPVFDANGQAIHQRGVVLSEPGLYFVGLPFQSSLLSGLVAGAGPDARHVVRRLAARGSAARPAFAGKLGSIHG